MVNNYQVLKEEEIEITIESVLFNKIHVQPNHLTNFILLVCKNLICSYKCRKVTPNVNMLEKCVEDARKCEYYSKNNYRSEGIRYANARTKVIIFCKSHPLNWN